VTTDAKGAFTYRTTARESRAMTFAYQGSAVRLPGSTTVHLSVPATSTVRVNRRHVFNGDTVTFTGRLKGGNVPAGGKLVILEAWVRGVWQPIAQMRTTTNGRWHAQHTFTTVAGRAQFRFRLSIPHDNLYPFASGNSGRINVVVEGL
jgi:hypothetical protein